MKIYIAGEKELFNETQKENFSKYGELLFLDSNNYIETIINDSNEKVIIYDPDFGGWDFPREIFESSLNLNAIFLGSTSNRYIDLDYAEKKNIKVFSIPKYSTNSVAEYFVMMMLDCARKIPLQIKNNNKQEFIPAFEQMQLKGKNVGIVGYGNIGSRIADICNGIGMNVFYWDRKEKETSYKRLSLDELFSTSDIIYISLAINDETKKLISDDLLNKLKPTSIFITCIGKNLFNSDLIEEKVKNNELYGYALEDANKKLADYEGNVMVTSEYAWFTKEASEARINLWAKMIIEFLTK